jgi:hypothetical protein
VAAEATKNRFKAMPDYFRSPALTCAGSLAC